MPLDKELLDGLVAAAPRLDRIFEQVGKPEGEKGACATYSRLAMEVLGERGIKAEVRPVYIETANRPALAYLRGKINLETAKKEGARIQVWGDLREGQSFQHAVCYVPDWDVVVDLAMAQRASKLVPCHPYWAKVGEWPWWLVKFELKTYPLEYRGYETQPDKVKQAKEYLRKLGGKSYLKEPDLREGLVQELNTLKDQRYELSQRLSKRSEERSEAVAAFKKANPGVIIGSAEWNQFLDQLNIKQKADPITRQFLEVEDKIKAVQEKLDALVSPAERGLEKRYAVLEDKLEAVEEAIDVAEEAGKDTDALVARRTALEKQLGELDEVAEAAKAVSPTSEGESYLKEPATGRCKAEVKPPGATRAGRCPQPAISGEEYCADHLAQAKLLEKHQRQYEHLRSNA